MTISEAISRAKKDSGVSSDDSFIGGSRYLYSILKSVRSELLRQEIEKKGIWPNFPMQTLSKFKYKQIDIAESELYIAGTYLLKSEVPFPELMDTKKGKITTGSFLPNGTRIEITTYTNWRTTLERRFKSGLPVFFLRDRYAFIANYGDDMETLHVDTDGLFEDPEEVDRLNHTECDGVNACIYYPDLPFRLPQYLEGRFFRMVKEDATWSKRIPQDTRNDGADITSPQMQNANG